MTDSERARFIQRRRNDLYALATNFFLVGPLIYSIPVLVLVLLAACCVWIASLFLGDRAWSAFLPASIAIVTLGVLVYVTIYRNVITFGVDRTKLTRDAVLRILEVDRDKLKDCIIGYTPNDHRYVDSASVVLLDLPGVGLSFIPIAEPDEGELRRSDDGAFRVAWSPLRQFLVEWIEVPSDWPDSIEPVVHDQRLCWKSLTSISRLNEMFESVQSTKNPRHMPGARKNHD